MAITYPLFLSMGNVVSGFPDLFKPHVVQTKVDQYNAGLTVKANGPFGITTIGHYSRVVKAGSRDKEQSVYRLKALKSSSDGVPHATLDAYCIPDLLPTWQKHEMDNGKIIVVSDHSRQLLAIYVPEQPVHLGSQTSTLFRMQHVSIYPKEDLTE